MGEEPLRCDFILEDGSACPMAATHFWGHAGHRVFMCCAHFDQFAPTLFRDGRVTIAPETGKPKHLDIVEEYNRQCKRPSQIPGTKCDPSSPAADSGQASET